MCGIYGKYGTISTFELIDKLKMLEYRGYDSCGVAFTSKDKAYIYKACGNTSKLRDIIDYYVVDKCIAHTRWATHGEVNIINAHPHTTKNNRFIIVHNGVIDNYLDLKNKYSIELNSQTDTEIIVHLLDIFSYSCDDMLSVIRSIMDELEGSYAVLILDKYNDKIYFMKDKSPLLIAEGDSGISIASDQIVFNANDKIVILNDLDYGYIDDTLFIDNINGNNKRNSFIKIDRLVSTKSSKHYMLDEILYEPIMIKDISLKYSSIDACEFKELVNNSNEICFVGAGSSYYAGTILKHKYEAILNKRCYSVIASEIDFFRIINDKTLFIFITQSGETLDLCVALNKLKGKYKIVALCNNVHSTIGYNADLVYPLCAGEEVAVASTKAFMAMVYVGELLINSSFLDSSKIVSSINAVISNNNQIEEDAKKIIEAKKIFYLGKGMDYVVCKEAALKLREVSYLNSFAFCSGELKHGSIALVDNDTLCIGLLSNNSYQSDIKNSLEEVKSRGSSIILIENNLYALIVYIELLAYYAALQLNRNIDQPRNLAKSVTVK